MTAENALHACQFSQWYPIFVKHALRGEVITLPATFVKFLLADGVVVGDSSRAMPALGQDDPHALEDEYRRDSWGDRATGSARGGSDHSNRVSGDASDRSSDGAEAAGFFDAHPQIERAINDAVSSLGGSVFPKAGWSAPTDATWLMMSGQAKCAHADEIALLLKSSDRVAHDLSLCQQGEGQAALVLKEWYDLRPEREFRCFVRGGQLVAASQRHMTQHYPQLEGQEREISRQLSAFHDDVVRPSPFPLEHYCYDVYLLPSGRVRILDFNPWRGTSAALLFAWEELEGLRADSGAGCLVRVSDGEGIIQPGPQSLLAVPYEFASATSVQDILAQMESAALTDQQQG
ncbi:unnamed protein product [Pedinophyceae sp. YPF-701]|nr:unnamed protein product [Pedinophyceae sp. YPF-701]